jgi:hypothetical protein
MPHHTHVRVRNATAYGYIGGNKKPPTNQGPLYEGFDLNPIADNRYEP